MRKAKQCNQTVYFMAFTPIPCRSCRFIKRNHAAYLLREVTNRPVTNEKVMVVSLSMPFPFRINKPTGQTPRSRILFKNHNLVSFLRQGESSRKPHKASPYNSDSKWKWHAERHYHHFF